MIRAAVIGLGRWGRNHVRSVQGGDDLPSPHVRFVRAVVQTPERSADFAREHGLALGTDLRAVLADPSIDAVVLATGGNGLIYGRSAKPVARPRCLRATQPRKPHRARGRYRRR